ncbi:hypothetical protein T492DRAFT_1018202 [Pavlovales sp. CCMP2436]|nr:hypothetical protein T492DRAFT_1018202 [Pavlovales sp. CCMP2436]|mmetsp:Transcript_32512/g.80878  ORF Transcript_32512/g.80878 Transcript_32512/m.80878 type:complete len:111 (+) Transcript_32512:14-346(+)
MIPGLGPQRIALGLVGVGAALAAAAASKVTPANPADNPYLAEGRARAGKMNELLASLPAKSTRDKVSDAYDAAVRTHEIGFPYSKPTALRPSLAPACDDRITPTRREPPP